MRFGIFMKTVLQKLRQQFELPVYTDELQRQRVNLLVSMLRGGVILVLMSSLVTLLTGLNSPWVYLAFMVTLVLLLIFRLWMRRGPLELIGYLLIQSGGPGHGGDRRAVHRSPVAIAYLLVIIAAGLLLDRRALAATVVASACGAGAGAGKVTALQPVGQYTP
jgi:hypothetical protein